MPGDERAPYNVLKGITDFLRSTGNISQRALKNDPFTDTTRRGMELLVQFMSRGMKPKPPGPPGPLELLAGNLPAAAALAPGLGVIKNSSNIESMTKTAKSLRQLLLSREGSISKAREFIFEKPPGYLRANKAYSWTELIHYPEPLTGKSLNEVQKMADDFSRIIVSETDKDIVEALSVRLRDIREAAAYEGIGSVKVSEEVAKKMGNFFK